MYITLLCHYPAFRFPLTLLCDLIFLYAKYAREFSRFNLVGRGAKAFPGGGEEFSKQACENSTSKHVKME